MKVKEKHLECVSIFKTAGNHCQLFQEVKITFTHLICTLGVEWENSELFRKCSFTQREE